MAGINSQGIPKEIIAFSQWVNWRAEKKDNGKITKIPICSKTGRKASHSDEKTWSSYQDALSRYNKGKVSGIGFVFSKNDPFCAIDLDSKPEKNIKCRDVSSGKIEPWAKEIIRKFNSWCEISPSGTGVHIICRGKLPAGGRKRPDIEIYDTERYFTVTGNHLAGTPKDIRPAQNAIDWLLAKYFKKKVAPQAPASSSSPRPSLSESELIQKAIESKNGHKFNLLNQGQWEEVGYPSQSEADLSLCNLLAFWNGRDPGRMDAMFRQSGLMRPKWDERHSGDGQTYGQVTIEKAIASCHETYTGTRTPQQATSPPDKESKIDKAHSEPKGPGQAEPQDDLLDFEILEKPHLDIAKISGITKAFVDLATRNSEADPAAVQSTFLARFGVEVGRKPFFRVGDSVHHGRIAVVIVGESSRSRKGTSEKPVERLFSFNSFNSSSEYKKPHVSPGPFSSGEGIIYAVRDPIEGWNRKKQATEIIDPGISDKRLFVLDEEFAGVLANTHREGNTLSMVIRSAWDNGRFDPLTKNSKISATDAHVGWVSHITGYELQAKLPECEGFNGFCNRILWVFAQRRKIVPMPEPMPTKELTEIQYLLLSILNKCHECKREIAFSKQAKEAWIEEYYQRLTSRNGNGLLAVVTNRAEAQVRRLALLFTLLDGEDTTSLKHLNQAMAAWKYCEDSAAYIFKGQAQDSVARKIAEALQDKKQLTSTEISNLFSRNIKSDRLQQAIQELIANDTAEMISEPTKGRSFKILKLKHSYEINEINEIRSDDRANGRVNSLNSFNSYRDSGKKPVGQETEDLGSGCTDVDEGVL